MARAQRLVVALPEAGGIVVVAGGELVVVVAGSDLVVVVAGAISL